MFSPSFSSLSLSPSGTSFLTSTVTGTASLSSLIQTSHLAILSLSFSTCSLKSILRLSFASLTMFLTSLSPTCSLLIALSALLFHSSPPLTSSARMWSSGKSIPVFLPSRRLAWADDREALGTGEGRGDTYPPIPHSLTFAITSITLLTFSSSLILLFSLMTKWLLCSKTLLTLSKLGPSPSWKVASTFSSHSCALLIASSKYWVSST
mmetsp:Transcript_10150/g.20786  ORF Transcript_10150/g.20786 Transcript_10150/m.20786 type:complete len:208 (-) Transcript_10150:1442-2065(-)